MGLFDSENLPKYLAEFMGTFILVSTVSFAVLGAAGVFTVTAIAASLMIAVYIFGSISGAHLNPAVTFAIWWGGQLGGEGSGVGLMSMYWVFQMLGGITAGCVGNAVYGGKALIEPGASYSLSQAFFGEFLYTAMLCFVVLNCACTKASAGNQYYGLAIGFVIIAAGYSWGQVSGGAFNPAVLFGFNLTSKSMSMHALADMGVYVVAELLGAMAAAGIWMLVRAEDFGGEKNSLFSRCLSEFIGTFYLCFTVAVCVGTGVSSTAWVAAAALMVMIYSVGNCSGAHLNPAVTFAVLLSGRHKISVKDAIAYGVTQFLAGDIAGALAFAILKKSGHPGPVGHFGWTSVGIAEAVYTSILCFTVLSCLTVKPAEWTKDFFGLAIASCVTLGGFAAGSISGGALNPAVAAGLDVGSWLDGGHWGNSVAYSMFEFGGAILATGAFWMTRPDEYAAARKAYDKA